MKDTIKLKKESYLTWLASGTSEAADGYRQTKQNVACEVADAKIRVWEEFGEFGEAMKLPQRDSVKPSDDSGGESSVLFLWFLVWVGCC